MNEGENMSKYILDDIVEEFFDEDSIEQDIHQHPLSWSLALLCVLPPIVLLLGATSGNNTASSEIMVFFVLLAFFSRPSRTISIA